MAVAGVCAAWVRGVYWRSLPPSLLCSFSLPVPFALCLNVSACMLCGLLLVLFFPCSPAAHVWLAAQGGGHPRPPPYRTQYAARRLSAALSEDGPAPRRIRRIALRIGEQSGGGGGTPPHAAETSSSGSSGLWETVLIFGGIKGTFASGSGSMARRVRMLYGGRLW